MRVRMSLRRTPANPTPAATRSSRWIKAAVQALSTASRIAVAPLAIPTRSGLEGPAIPSPIIRVPFSTTARVRVPPPSTPIRAHKTIYDGCQFARAPRRDPSKRFRFEDPDVSLVAADRGTAPTVAAGVHGRREQHDRQRARPGRVRPVTGSTMPCSTSTTPTASVSSANGVAERARALRNTWERHRPLRERDLRQPRVGQRVLEGVLVAVGVHRLPTWLKNHLKVAAAPYCTRGRRLPRRSRRCWPGCG